MKPLTLRSSILSEEKNNVPFLYINVTGSKMIIHACYFTVLSNIFAALISHLELIDANTVGNRNGGSLWNDSALPEAYLQCVFL